MGEFLSTPNRKKISDDNSNEYLRYGSCGMQGWRKRMEDAHITDISKGENGRFQIFGVFDGHGGKEVSQFVKKHFTEELLKLPQLKEGNIKNALKATFLKMDDLMRTPAGKAELLVFSELSKKEDDEQDQENKSGSTNPNMEMINRLIAQQRPKEDVAMMTGCTACVCLIDEKDKKMYFANAGDSRVVLCRKGKAEAMSEDHKPEQERERARIYKAEGWITEGRVKGNLNLSRGFGDLEYKQKANFSPEEQMITANPDIRVENLDNSCDFVILGCDGIWDCLSNQEACNWVINGLKENPNIEISKILEKMLDHICATDIYNETGVGCDNMTCCVALFKK